MAGTPSSPTLPFIYTSKMPVRCTEHQDAFVWVVYLVGEKDEWGKALFANVERGVGIFLQNCHSFLPNGWHTIITNSVFISTLIKSIVGDDGVPAILQYRPSDLYLTDRKETMAIYPHSSPHLQIRPSLVHPFLPQDLDVPCNARASC